MRHEDTDLVTWGDLRKVFKRLDSRVDEAFDHATKLVDGQIEFWNEHEEKLERLRRAVKRMEDHVHEDD